jgi:hypothetical protein
VPTTWWGSDSPDPFDGFEGDPAAVGPVLFVSSPLVPIHVALERATDGAAVPLFGGGDDPPLPEQTLEADSGFTPLFAVRRLEPRTRYRLLLRRDDGWARALVFATDDGSGPHRAAVAASDTAKTAGRARCQVRASARRRPHAAVVRFRRSGACAGIVLERRAKHGWRHLARKVRVRLPTALAWRARRGTALVTHGVVWLRVEHAASRRLAKLL